VLSPALGRYLEKERPMRHHPARSVLAAVAAWLACGLAAAPAGAQMRRLSVTLVAGTEANGPSHSPAISESGRIVAFLSSATNLDDGDTNGVDDLFVVDRDPDADGIFDEPGDNPGAQRFRGLGSVQPNAAISAPALSADGRYLVFVTAASNLLTQFPEAPMARQVYRLDRWGTLVRVSLGVGGAPANGDCANPVVSGDGRYVAFTSVATNLTTSPAGDGGAVFLADLTTGAIVQVSPALPLPEPPIMPPGFVQQVVGRVSIDAGGRTLAYSLERHVTYRTFYAERGRISIYDIATGATRTDVVVGHSPAVLEGGRALGYLDAERGELFAAFRPGGWLDLETGAKVDVTDNPTLAPKAILWSADGRYAAFFTRHPFRWPFEPEDTRPFEPYLFDRRLAGAFLLPAGTRLGPLDGAGRAIVFASPAANLVTGDANDADDIFLLDLARHFDADTDGLDDRWERTVGLDPASASGANGPDGDPDDDGVSNAAELAAGSHPRGSTTRYLAEGATGAFFDTLIAVANPAETEASAVVRVSTDGGAQRWTWMRLPPRSRRTVDVEALDGLESAAFAVAVESDTPVVVDRRMAWGAGGYGAHAETSMAAPQTSWFFAEGATGGGFDLFYLLQNPGDEPADAEIRFLRPFGAAPLVRTYRLPPRSRTTIYVDAVAPELAATDVSAAIAATRPIAAERAMYLGDASMPFRGGHAAAGVSAAAADWFFAEGATGSFFELFLLLANPATEAASATVTYTTDAGLSLTKSYALPPQSRRTIWVDEETFDDRGKALADAAVSARVSATQPIVAERAMWWPGGQPWVEGHVSAGARSAAARWVLADGGTGGPRRLQTYVLIANPNPVPATVTVRVLREVLGTELEPVTVVVAAESRYTVDMSTAFQSLPVLSAAEQRFGVLVESTTAGAPIVVERAMYWDTPEGVWEAGTGAVATPLP
jgi:hypothetical protein